MKRRAVVLVTLLWLVACPGPGLSQVTVAPPPPPTAAGLSTEGEVRRIDARSAGSRSTPGRST
jgi:hypothetical protein